MNIEVKQLEINVNLHCLQPDFLNYELHYIIAKSENKFRFVAWNEEPGMDEQKFYCFLMDRELFIPAGSIALKESYVVKEEPIYPFVANEEDFISVIEALKENRVAKCIRRFRDENIDAIKNGLQKKYGNAEKHLVTSDEAQHLLLILNDTEISISVSMVYFRPKAPFSEAHYQHVKE